MKVLLFDDELQEKQALFKLPELTLLFYPHADDVVAAVRQQQPDLGCGAGRCWYFARSTGHALFGFATWWCSVCVA